MRYPHSHNPDLENAGAELVRTLGGVWRGDHGMCRCPAHADHSPSLSVRVGERALLFKCFAGCASRDVVREILRIDDRALRSSARPDTCDRRRSAQQLGRQRALRIWDQSLPLIGSPAEVYLRRRHIALLPKALRFNPRTPLKSDDSLAFRPAMIAAVHERGRLVAVQRTFFDRDAPRRARDLADPKRLLGRPCRGAVMLADVSATLGLAEGVEAALSAMILFDMPVWATLGAERLHQITIPDRVNRLILFPDNDHAGVLAATHARNAYQCPGRSVETAFPPAPHKDWNDALRLGGKGVGEWWRQGA